MSSSGTPRPRPSFGARIAATYDELRPLDVGLERLVDHVERPAAFAEARRVLAPGGRLVIHNLDPDGLEELWYVRFFPSLLELEQARMPAAATLERELGEAGFAPLTVERVAIEREFDRETALRKLRGRHTSSFDLLEEDEIAAGLERAEREVPERVRYVLRDVLLVAER